MRRNRPTRYTEYKRREPYAHNGEMVVCSGPDQHPICDFLQDVYVGDMQDLGQELGNFRQTKPTVGQLKIPRCEICGAKWYISGGLFHFRDGWRDPYKLIKKYGFPEE